MSEHQRYLEAPYDRQALAQQGYEEWCEREGLDSEEDHWDEYEVFDHSFWTEEEYDGD